MTCHKFSKKIISRFVDNDLDKEDRTAFIRHKAQCPDCCAVEARFRQTGMIFEQQADVMAGQLLKDTPKIFITAMGRPDISTARPSPQRKLKDLCRLHRLSYKTNEKSHKFGSGLPIKRKSRSAQAVLAMLSLAVLVAIMYLVPGYQGKPLTGLAMQGPSAVVNSVDAYGSSVMILETAETHHTIIWFSET